MDVNVKFYIHFYLLDIIKNNKFLYGNIDLIW